MSSEDNKINAYDAMLSGIQWVLDNRTSYQVMKDLGISNRTVNRYQNGETPIENMTMATAEMLYKYYVEEIGKMDRNELFGRALAVLDVIGMRRFEERKPSIESRFLSELRKKPMTVLFRAHTDVMQYATHFNRVDLSLFDRVTTYIDALGTEGYTDDPLTEVYILHFSKERANIKTTDI